MIDIDKIYENDIFMDFLQRAITRNIAYLGPMSSRQDYIQDIFVEIMESDCKSIHDCKKAAWRVLERERRNLKGQPVSVLWEDNHIIGGAV